MLRKETNQEEKFAHHFDVQIHELYAIICLGAQKCNINIYIYIEKTRADSCGKEKHRQMIRHKGKEREKRPSWVKTTEKQGLYEVPHFATIERPGKEEAVYEM